MQKTNSLISHRQFYSGHLAQAVILYFERKTPERAWHLAQAAGQAGLFGVDFLNVIDSLRDSSNLSCDCISGAKDILSVPEAGSSKPRSETAEEFLQLVFQFLPSVKIREVIEDYLEELNERISEEWGEEDDTIIIYHTRVVSGFQWLCERVMDDEKILPLFVGDLDAFGSMICEANETIRLQLHCFIGGLPIASFIWRGVVKDRLTENFVFLSDEFLNLKGPDFVLPLPEKAADAPILKPAGMIREPEKPYWKEGLEEWLNENQGFPEAFVLSNAGPPGYPLWEESMVQLGDEPDLMPPKVEGNCVRVSISIPRDGRDTKILPPESAEDRLQLVNQILTYFTTLESCYYAVQAWREDGLLAQWPPERLPREILSLVSLDIPVRTEKIIIGFHTDPDLLDKVMTGRVTNAHIRKQGRLEVFFFFFTAVPL